MCEFSIFTYSSSLTFRLLQSIIMEIFLYYSAMLSIFICVVLFVTSLIFSYLERKKNKSNIALTLFRASYIFFIFPIALLYAILPLDDFAISYFLFALLLMTPALLAYTLLNNFLSYTYLPAKKKKVVHKKSYVKPTNFNSIRNNNGDNYQTDSSSTNVNPVNGLPMTNDSFDALGNPFGFDYDQNDDFFR